MTPPQPKKPKRTGKPQMDAATMRAIEAVAERAAKRAVHRATRDMKELLLSIGVNASSPDGVVENQKDAAWLRRIRLTSESAPAKLSLALFGAGLSVIGGLIVYFFKHFFDTYFGK